MNLSLGKLGAEPRKVVLLGLLAAVAAYLLVSNWSSDGSGAPAAPAARPAPAAAAAERSPGQAWPREGNRDGLREFKPSLKPPKDMDVTRIDPTLKLALLERLRAVTLQGGERSLFEFSQAPAEAVKEPPAIHPKGPVRPLGAGASETAAHSQAAEKPAPPPIPLKFYGFVSPSRTGQRRAFFLDGEDILVAGEGDLLKQRYKVVRIGLTSATVEDTQFKNEQTLQLVPEESS